MNLKLWPGIATAVGLLGLGFLCAWAIWGRTPPPKIPKDATVRTTAPLLPLPPPDSGQQSFNRLGGSIGKAIADSLAFEKNKVLALQRLSVFYRDSIGGLLEKLKLPYRFTAVKDTNLPHTKDSVVIDLMTGKADFFQSGLSAPVGTHQNQKFGLSGLYQPLFLVEGVVWDKGPPEALISLKNPIHPFWWSPGRIGGAFRADGRKGLVLGWPIP